MVSRSTFSGRNPLPLRFRNEVRIECRRAKRPGSAGITSSERVFQQLRLFTTVLFKICATLFCIAKNPTVFPMKKSVWRAVIEVGFIVFLFYSNLLMGEFERSGMGHKRGVVWAIVDVFTAANFEIAAIAAIIGYILFEFLRKNFK